MAATAWTALLPNGEPLLTVIAHTEEEAREWFQDQLTRPGRLPFYRKWVEGGRLIRPKSN